MPDSRGQSPDAAPHDDVAAYEAAHDVLGQLIGYASSRIDEEKNRSPLDSAAVEEWQRRQQEWSSRWHSLRASDAAAVQRVLDEDAAVLRSLPTS